MLNEIMHINEEAEARRILMKLGNGMTQVAQYLEEWRKAKEVAKPAPVVQKVITEAPTIKEPGIPLVRQGLTKPKTTTR